MDQWPNMAGNKKNPIPAPGGIGWSRTLGLIGQERRN